MNEIMESINSFELTDKEVKMEVSFDEFNLDINVTYKGTPFEFPDKKPTKEDLIKDESAALKLSAFMIKRFPDSLKSETKEDSVKIILHFNH
jgi:NCS2 family nucleobase:cation symporter-2